MRCTPGRRSGWAIGRRRTASTTPRSPAKRLCFESGLLARRWTVEASGLGPRGFDDLCPRFDIVARCREEGVELGDRLTLAGLLAAPFPGLQLALLLLVELRRVPGKRLGRSRVSIHVHHEGAARLADPSHE